MRSSLLAHYVRSLHLRQDAPMPSEIRQSHERINGYRFSVGRGPLAKVLPFPHKKPCMPIGQYFPG